MGFSFRKSKKIGPVRVNVSKSGVGISAGVKGARVGINAKGKAYVSGGTHGLYYRSQIEAEQNEIPENIELENQMQNQKLGLLGGFATLVIIISLFSLIFSVKGGLIGLAVGFVLIIIGGVQAAIKQGGGGFEAPPLGSPSPEYAKTLERHIVKDDTLAPDAVEELIAERNKILNITAEAAQSARAELLRARAEYQSARKQMPKQEAPVHISEKKEEDIAEFAFKYATEKNPDKPKEAVRYFIEYSDFNGDVTRREIDVKDFELADDGTLYLNAWCHLRNAQRKFRIERIMRLCGADGKEILNPTKYFEEMFENTDGRKIEKYFEAHSDELKVFIFLARADGQMRKNEREIIVDFVRKELNIENNEILDRYIKNYSCELSEFGKILKKLKTENVDKKKNLIEYAEKIYSLKKNPDAMETGAIQKIRAIAIQK